MPHSPEENPIIQVMTHAKNGDINELYSSIKMNPHLLSTIDETQFANSPLHEAATHGATSFALELMVLKPSLGKKLNPEGLTSLHLAIEKKKKETALALSRFDKQLVCVKGRGGHTPLHYAAMGEEHSDLLASFVYECPESLDVLNNRSQNALHVALEKSNYKGAHILSKWIFMSGWWWDALECRDDEGNTPFHVALLHNPVDLTIKQMIEGLRNGTSVINQRNSNGKTCLDIAEAKTCQYTAEIVKLLKQNGAKTSANLPSEVTLEDYLHSDVTHSERAISEFNIGRKLVRSRRDMYLVVAVLIATATFQSAIQPPGGFYQNDPNQNNGKTDGFKLGRTVLKEIEYSWFIPINTLAFMLSVQMIANGLFSDTVYLELLLSLVFLAIGYLVSTLFVYDYSMSSVVCCAVFFVYLIYVTIYRLRWLLTPNRYMRKFYRRNLAK